jgi:phospholipid-binding lipoprotein MlaA
MGAMTRVVLLGAAGLFLAGLAGCATPPPADDPDAVADFKQTNDPLEPTNRVFYKVNQGLDTLLLRPVALAYTAVTPVFVRNRVHDLLGNLSSPVLLANDILQAKPRRGGDTLMRFVINTTVGVGGLFDVATDWGYPYHDANFGETLALWGVPAGPYLFLPILGPGDPRDTSGYAADQLLDPATWVGIFNSHAAVKDYNYAKIGLTLVDVRSGLLDTLDKATDQALDPYATVRSLYRQHRDAEIEAARNDQRATKPAWNLTNGAH